MSASAADDIFDWAATISDLCGDPDLQSPVQEAVDRANSAVVCTDEVSVRPGT